MVFVLVERTTSAPCSASTSAQRSASTSEMRRPVSAVKAMLPSLEAPRNRDGSLSEKAAKWWREIERFCPASHSEMEILGGSCLQIEFFPGEEVAGSSPASSHETGLPLETGLPSRGSSGPETQ